jgi:hypothetical protein
VAAEAERYGWRLRREWWSVRALSMKKRNLRVISRVNGCCGNLNARNSRRRRRTRSQPPRTGCAHSCSVSTSLYSRTSPVWRCSSTRSTMVSREANSACGGVRALTCSGGGEASSLVERAGDCHGRDSSTAIAHSSVLHSLLSHRNVQTVVPSHQEQPSFLDSYRRGTTVHLRARFRQRCHRLRGDSAASLGDTAVSRSGSRTDQRRWQWPVIAQYVQCAEWSSARISRPEICWLTCLRLPDCIARSTTSRDDPRPS